MWVREGDAWHYMSCPELEVLPCVMDDGSIYWACFFEGKPCTAVGASPSSADVMEEAYKHFSKVVDL